MSEARHAQLIAWLEDQGHSDQEIDRIMAKVASYDQRTAHESVFDSIDSGGLDLKAIIREALDDEEEGPASQA